MSSLPKILISAMSYDHVIGDHGQMPWNIPEEYQQYLNFIQGQTVIMGRTSYEVFGEDLTSKHTLVITRQNLDLPGVQVCNSVQEALEAAEGFGKKVFIAGGASIYEQTIEFADYLYLSYIKGDFSGDRYFPPIDTDTWEVEERRDHPEFEFVKYGRKT